MTAISFPESPVDDQEFEAPNGVTYQWDEANNRWEILSSGGSGGSGGDYLPLTGGNMGGDINMLNGSDLTFHTTSAKDGTTRSTYGRISMHDPNSDDPNIQLGAEGLFKYVTPLSTGINFEIVDPFGTKHAEDYLFSVQRAKTDEQASVMYYGDMDKDDEVVTKKFVEDSVSDIDVSDQINDKVSKSGDEMSGTLSMNKQRLTNLCDPQDGYDAVHATYVDSEVAQKIDKKGDTMDGDFDFDGNCRIRVKGDVVVKDKGQVIGGENLIGVYPDLQRVQYWGKIDEDKCVVTKKYVDDHAGGADIEDVGQGAPPSSRPRGTIVLAGDKLYYYN